MPTNRSPRLLCVLLLSFALGAQAAPDLSSRNTVPTGRIGDVTATDGPWVAVADSSWEGDEYLQSAQGVTGLVQVIGLWDGTPITIREIVSTTPQNEVFGEALGLDGGRLAVGAPSEGASRVVECNYLWCTYTWDMLAPGKVHLYQFDGTDFVPERSITRGDALGQFGHALALEQGKLLVGAPGAVPGMAYLFDADTGDEITTFTSPTSESDDDFGRVVALKDSLAVIGAPASDTVYVYQDSGSGWNLLAVLTNPNGEAAEFGVSLAVDNGRILIGTRGFGVDFGVDKAYLYDLADIEEGTTVPVDNNGWPAAQEFSGTQSSGFGRAVALLGDIAWISASNEIIEPGSIYRGKVRQYEYDQATGWTLAYTFTTGPGFGGLGAAMAASADIFTVATSVGRHQVVFTAPDNVYDTDGDAVAQIADNCPDAPNTDQSDVDLDGDGDVCDVDIDGDNLTNEEEVVLGTDPYKEDTDGDGLRDDLDPVPTHVDIDEDGHQDPNDNCPTIANPGQEDYDGYDGGDVCDDDDDNDSLLDVDEIAAGTDPFNKDTDGDGTEDDDDLLPADVHDGWPLVYRFPLERAEYVAVDGNLAIATNDGEAVSAYARVEGEWEEIAAPDLDSLGAQSIEGIALSGNTAAIITKEYASSSYQTGKQRPVIFIFDWDPQGGWVFAQDFEPPLYRHNVEELRLDGGLLVTVGRPVVWGDSFYGLKGLVAIYQRQEGLFQSTGFYGADGWQDQLEAQISGDKVYVGDDIFSDPTVLHVMSATGEIEDTIVTPIKKSASCANPANSPLVNAGNGKLLLSTDGSDYWVEQSEIDGSLQLEEVAFGNNNIGGLGDNGLIGLDFPVTLSHPISGDAFVFNLEVLRMVDGQSLGLIPNTGRYTSSCPLQWATDGNVVITAGYGDVNIYPIDRDGDGVFDGNDNCPNEANPDQSDADGDGIGDVCEPPGC